MRVPWPLRVLLALFAVALLIQLVPYGRDHDHPAVAQEPAWSSDEARALVVGACFDCHSNQTKWPWYSNVAPQSWLVQRDVDRGRAALNFSEWPPEDDDLADPVEDGDMPPWQYRLMHPDARLSAAEKAALIAELEAIAESEGDGDGGGNRGPGGGGNSGSGDNSGRGGGGD